MVASEKTDLSNAVRICKTLLLSYFINQILRSETEKKKEKTISGWQVCLEYTCFSLIPRWIYFYKRYAYKNMLCKSLENVSMAYIFGLYFIKQ